MNKVLLAPSILSADFAELGVEIDRVTQAGADWIHVDVMDGNFVPNLTIGMPVVKSLKPKCKIPLDVHLMIDQPERYVDEFVKAGADYLTLHVESTNQLADTLKKIKSLGCKPGITLRPKTSLETIKPFLNLVDLVLIMTVEPGFGGQSFMTDQMAKVTEIKKWRTQKLGNYLIEVDGGINPHTAKLCIAAGADVLVAGNAVFNGAKTEANYKINMDALR